MQILRPHPLRLAALLVVSLLLLAACAGNSSTTIGILSLSPAHDYSIDKLKELLADSGYVEGENVEYVYAGAPGEIDPLTGQAEDLVEAEVDVIYALTTPAVLAAAAATDTIPIVFNAIADPVAIGIVDDLTQPGGNLTGLKAGGFIAKQPSYLLSLVPDATTALVLSDPADGASVVALELTLPTLEGLGVTPTVIEASSTEELEAAMASLPEADGMIILASSLFFSNASLIVDAAVEQGLPTVGAADMHALGYLAAYGPTFSRMTEQIMPLLVEVIEGANPGDLPVVVADFDLRLNMGTANRMGFEVPAAAIQQAVEVLP